MSRFPLNCASAAMATLVLLAPASAQERGPTPGGSTTRAGQAPPAEPQPLEAPKQSPKVYYGVGKERSTATGGEAGGNPNEN